MKTQCSYHQSIEIKEDRKKLRFRVDHKFVELQKNIVRKTVHDFFREGVLPTLDKLMERIKANDEIPLIGHTTLHTLLKKKYITYVKHKRNSYLPERDDLLAWRRQYLEDIRKYRAEGRNIYFLDETWVNAGDVTVKAWHDETIKSGRDDYIRGLTTEPANPSGKGKKLIVLHLGSAEGFVEGGFLSFVSKKNSSEYHDEMNGDTFREWFEAFLGKLHDNCVIVMDNASYHSVREEKVPSSSWKKNDIQNWLHVKGYEFRDTMIKGQLLSIVKEVRAKHDKCAIDTLAESHGKIVLRLPSYHCELNPIEMVWSMVKGYVTSNNSTFKMSDVLQLLRQGIERVTAENWRKFC
ncbi:uncharacterized protein LOC117182635 [Belonocnema kinseyi]|uniref:uncharacterized protein LOC117182635 n=1 Tax=Belonocnema kinseyi TaxID=2817044 RepID=UPI00143DD507|nr:uncharacterized protein LOC117182635 [Belonocnema kinseyi]